MQMWFLDAEVAADPGVGMVTAVALDPDVAMGADVVDPGAVVYPDVDVDPDVAAAAGQ